MAKPFMGVSVVTKLQMCVCVCVCVAMILVSASLSGQCSQQTSNPHAGTTFFAFLQTRTCHRGLRYRHVHAGAQNITELSDCHPMDQPPQLACPRHRRRGRRPPSHPDFGGDNVERWQDCQSYRRRRRSRKVSHRLVGNTHTHTHTHTQCTTFKFL